MVRKEPVKIFESNQIYLLNLISMSKIETFFIGIAIWIICVWWIDLLVKLQMWY